jgi:tRNA 2-selenouridine synthase
MERITKKLGGQHFNAAKEKWLAGDKAATIEILLTYYDKAYANGLHGKKQRIKLRPSWDGSDHQSLVSELLQTEF